MLLHQRPMKILKVRFSSRFYTASYGSSTQDLNLSFTDCVSVKHNTCSCWTSYNSNHQFSLWWVSHWFRFNKSFIEQEANLRQTHWTRSKENAGTIAETLHHPSSYTEMFLNVIKVFQLFLLTLTSAPSVEQFNASLRFVRNRMRSSMGEDRFNDLVLLHKQKDIELDIEEIFDTFAKKHPRKMLLLIHCLSCFARLLYFLKKLYALLFCKNQSQFT